MLSYKRDVWDMYFAESGAEALKMMRSLEFSLIVSDMRMPEINGAELLSIVREKYPQTIRIILSGFPDNEAVLRTVGVSHQYLAKPCEPALLEATISKILKISSMLDCEGIRNLISGLGSLPIPSTLFTTLMMELKSPKASAKSVSNIIKSDISLSSQILKLCNNAYFALPMRISNIEHAVQFLGFDTIQSLALTTNFFQTYTDANINQVRLETLNERSFFIGALSRQLCYAQNCTEEEASTAFCIGLLSHIGTLFLMINFPKKFDATMACVDENQCDLLVAEKRTFGSSHADVGAYILGIWGLPDPVIEGVRDHHDSRVMEINKFSINQAVYIAQAFGRYSRTGVLEGNALVPFHWNRSITHNAKYLSQFKNWRYMFEEAQND